MINISVIIPNYNHGLFLSERIETVLNQTYENFEIIILDDFSTDNSREIIEKFRDNEKVSHIIYSTKNSGSPFRQWEKGIKLAKYEWIWIAESDDICKLNFIEEAVKMISEYTDAGFYFCNSIIKSDEGVNETTSEFSHKQLRTNKWNEKFYSSGLEEINIALKYYSNIPNTSAVIFRKDKTKYLFKTLDKFKFCGDWYTYIFILRKTNLVYNNQTLNTFRRTRISHSVINKDNSKIIKKTELFRVLNLLVKTPGVENKNVLIAWFTKMHIGFGFKTEGFSLILKILLNYYRINFFLTNRFLLVRIKIKITSSSKKHKRI